MATAGRPRDALVESMRVRHATSGVSNRREQVSAQAKAARQSVARGVRTDRHPRGSIIVSYLVLGVA
jgi:hypothetical protein